MSAWRSLPRASQRWERILIVRREPITMQPAHLRSVCWCPRGE